MRERGWASGFCPTPACGQGFEMSVFLRGPLPEAFFIRDDVFFPVIPNADEVGLP